MIYTEFTELCRQDESIRHFMSDKEFKNSISTYFMALNYLSVNYFTLTLKFTHGFTILLLFISMILLDGLAVKWKYHYFIEIRFLAGKILLNYR